MLQHGAEKIVISSIDLSDLFISTHCKINIHVHSYHHLVLRLYAYKIGRLSIRTSGCTNVQTCGHLDVQTSDVQTPDVRRPYFIWNYFLDNYSKRPLDDTIPKSLVGQNDFRNNICL